MPSLPKNEDDRTTLPISVLEGFSEELIENAIEDVYGKVQIMDQTILRDMPEGQMKSTIIFEWFSEYSSFLKMECAKASCGTVGIRFQNGTLLSPDFAIWTSDRLDGRHVCAHMMQVARIPNLVCELEWLEEINQPRKGVDKIVNYYLNPEYFGLPDDRGVPTEVEEVWLVVARRAGSLPVVPEEVDKLSPSKSFLAELLLPIPVLNWVLDFVIQLALWSAVAAQGIFMLWMTRCSWIQVVLWMQNSLGCGLGVYFLFFPRDLDRLWTRGSHTLQSTEEGTTIHRVLCYAPPVSTNLLISHFYKAR
eukprot:gene26565-34790_t